MKVSVLFSFLHHALRSHLWTDPHVQYVIIRLSRQAVEGMKSTSKQQICWQGKLQLLDSQSISFWDVMRSRLALSWMGLDLSNSTTNTAVLERIVTPMSAFGSSTKKLLHIYCMCIIQFLILLYRLCLLDHVSPVWKCWLEDWFWLNYRFYNHIFVGYQNMWKCLCRYYVKSTVAWIMC